MASRTLDGYLGVAIISLQGEGASHNPAPEGTFLLGAKGNILIGLQHLLHTSCLVFSSKGEIYVADAGNGRVVRLSPEGKYLSEWGRKGKGESEFAAAHAIAIDGRDRIYVADRGNNRVQVFSPAGKFLAA